MNIQIRTLKADVAADLEAIAEIYAAINRCDTVPTGMVCLGASRPTSICRMRPWALWHWSKGPWHG